MFDLESAIENWKHDFHQDGLVSPENADELEAHLRDLTSDLQQKGLSQQEAFMIGTHRMGCAAELEKEFAKNCPTIWWRNRVMWMLTGYIAVSASGSLISMLVAFASASALAIGWAGSTAGSAMVVLNALCWICVLVAIYRQTQKVGVGSDRFSLVSAVSIGTLLILAPILRLYAHALGARMVDPKDYGELLGWTGFGGMFVHILVGAFILAMIWKLSESKAERNPAI
jgi:uncharacterized membrane protein